MEKGLIKLMEDFNSGKLRAFGEWAEIDVDSIPKKLFKVVYLEVLALQYRVAHLVAD